MDKIKIGLVLDIWHISNGGPSKYSGITYLMDSMLDDSRFDPYVVTTDKILNGKEGKFNKPYLDSLKSKGHKFLRFEEESTQDFLDYFIFTCPYRTHYKNVKIPYIYSEYGLDSIADDHTLVTTYGGIYKNASILLVSTKEKASQLSKLGIKGYIIDRKPNFDYPLFYKKDFYDKLHEMMKVTSIMYAPHHTTEATNSADDYKRFSTWRSFKDIFYKMAVDNPDKFFYYRPHPFLNKTEPSHSEYVRLLDSLENVQISNPNENYYYHFMRSDILLTDCISFIGEWMPTKKPLIRLYDDTSSKYSDRAEKIINDCYFNEHIEDIDIDTILTDRDIFYSSERRKESLNHYLSQVTSPLGNCSYILDKLYEYIRSN